MTIEFVGAGGSGKSYMSRKLMEGINDSAIIASELKLKAPTALREVILRPSIIFYALWIIWVIRPKSIRYAKVIFLIIIRIKIRLAFLNRKGYSLVIFDEGMLHKFRQMKRWSSRINLSIMSLPARLRSFMFDNSEIVVLLNPDLEQLIKRRKHRSKGNSQVYYDISSKYVQITASELRKSMEDSKADILTAQKEFGFKFLEVKGFTKKDIPKIKMHVLDQEISLSDI